MTAKESLCKRCAIKDCGPRIGLKIIMESDIVIECSDYLPK
jgi:hypothetical protein